VAADERLVNLPSHVGMDRLPVVTTVVLILTRTSRSFGRGVSTPRSWWNSKGYTVGRRLLACLQGSADGHRDGEPDRQEFEEAIHSRADQRNLDPDGLE